jgi:hypothetical protein
MMNAIRNTNFLKKNFEKKNKIDKKEKIPNSDIKIMDKKEDIMILDDTKINKNVFTKPEIKIGN